MTTILVLLPWTLLLAMAVRLRVAIARERYAEDQYQRLTSEAERLSLDLRECEETLSGLFDGDR